MAIWEVVSIIRLELSIRWWLRINSTEISSLSVHRAVFVYYHLERPPLLAVIRLKARMGLHVDSFLWAVGLAIMWRQRVWNGIWMIPQCSLGIWWVPRIVWSPTMLLWIQRVPWSGHWRSIGRSVIKSCLFRNVYTLNTLWMKWAYQNEFPKKSRFGGFIFPSPELWSPLSQKESVCFQNYLYHCVYLLLLVKNMVLSHRLSSRHKSELFLDSRNTTHLDSKILAILIPTNTTVLFMN